MNWPRLSLSPFVRASMILGWSDPKFTKQCVTPASRSASRNAKDAVYMIVREGRMDRDISRRLGEKGFKVQIYTYPYPRWDGSVGLARCIKKGESPLVPLIFSLQLLSAYTNISVFNCRAPGFGRGGFPSLIAESLVPGRASPCGSRLALDNTMLTTIRIRKRKRGKLQMKANHGNRPWGLCIAVIRL